MLTGAVAVMDMGMPMTAMAMATTTATTTGTTTATSKATTTTTSTATDPARPAMPRVRPAASPLPAAALLQLMWLASPALPVGGFSYSEALEAAVDDGLVTDEGSAGRWLLDQLHLGLQRADLPLLASAMHAFARRDAQRLAALNDWALQTRETFEMRQQTEQMGRSLTDWLRQRHPGDDRLPLLAALQPSPTWPLAFALAATTTGAPRRESLLAFGFGWAENQVGAAVKSVPLGQSAGQRLLGALAQALPAAVDAALATALAGDNARQNLAPMLAILSARHEAQYSRLFRS